MKTYIYSLLFGFALVGFGACAEDCNCDKEVVGIKADSTKKPKPIVFDRSDSLIGLFGKKPIDSVVGADREALLKAYFTKFDLIIKQTEQRKMLSTFKQNKPVNERLAGDLFNILCRAQQMGAGEQATNRIAKLQADSVLGAFLKEKTCQ